VLTRVKANLKGGVLQNKPAWFDAARMAPPIGRQSIGGRPQEIVLPTDALVNTYERRNPESLEEVLVYTHNGGPLATRALEFANRQLRLMNVEGVNVEVAYKRVEEEMEHDKRARLTQMKDLTAVFASETMSGATPSFFVEGDPLCDAYKGWCDKVEANPDMQKWSFEEKDELNEWVITSVLEWRPEEERWYLEGQGCFGNEETIHKFVDKFELLRHHMFAPQIAKGTVMTAKAIYSATYVGKVVELARQSNGGPVVVDEVKEEEEIPSSTGTTAVNDDGTNDMNVSIASEEGDENAEYDFTPAAKEWLEQWTTYKDKMEDAGFTNIEDWSDEERLVFDAFVLKSSLSEEEMSNLPKDQLMTSIENGREILFPNTSWDSSYYGFSGVELEDIANNQEAIRDLTDLGSLDTRSGAEWGGKSLLSDYEDKAEDSIQDSVEFERLYPQATFNDHMSQHADFANASSRDGVAKLDSDHHGMNDEIAKALRREESDAKRFYRNRRRLKQEQTRGGPIEDQGIDR
jgi:hypothetical protein